MKHKGKWKAKITINGKIKNIGTFTDLDLAIAAREKAEREYYPQYFQANEKGLQYGE